MSQVMDAPEAKVDAARDRFCPPYKPARWAPFLAEVLGRGAAARLLASDADAAAEGEPASPRMKRRRATGFCLAHSRDS